MDTFTPGRWMFLVLLGGFGFSNAVCAQTPVEATEATESPESPEATEATEATQKFLVQSVRIEGNTLLPESELAARVAHLIGGERTAGDLRQAARAVQAAYRQAGYAGVVAFVPEQRVASGDLVIRVVEGKLAEVRISGNQRYDQTNIRHSLPSLREGETPRVRAIDRDIQLANENPVKELRVALMAGTKPGDIDASIEVAEESPWRVLIGFDNTGDPATGDYRLSVGLQYANLWNLDHIGTVQYQTSPSDPSQVQIYSFGYRIPLYGHAASIDAFAAYSSVDNGTTATVAGPLQFAGKGKIAGLRGNRYLERIGEYDHRLTLGLDWRDLQNDCLLGAFGAAGCGTAGASIVVLPLSLTYTGQVQTPEEAWGFAGGLAHNVGGSSSEDFKAARPRADKYYSIARLTAFAGFAPADRFGLQGRLSGQYTPDALVPVEQFGVGGASSVRGYREREIAGDNGLYANLEGLAPDLRQHLGIDNGSLRPLVFVDWGQVSNHYHWPCAGTDTRCALSSFGVGVRFSVGKYLIGRFDVARTLEDGPQTPAGKTRGDIALSFVF